MAHELEIIHGEAQMFSVKETPWHNLGKIIKDAPAIEQVLHLAGLNWTVKTQPTFIQLPDGTYKKTEHRAIVRETDSNILGHCGSRYEPLQNTEMLEFFRPFVEEGLIQFETAGSLREGKKVWILAKVGINSEMEITEGDTVRKYLLLSNGHDGITGIRVGFSPIRVVCANTLAMSHQDRNSNFLRVFHSGRTKQSLEAIRDTVNMASQAFEATAEQYRNMTKRGINKKDLERFVSIVFYNDAQADSDRKSMARENLDRDIARLFETGRGSDIQGARNTMWGAYNAVTEYLSYERSTNPDIRLDNLWFGASKDLNQKAFEAAVQYAQSGRF